MSCATADYNRQTEKLTLPKPVEWSKEQQAEAADELQNCADCDMIARMLDKYHKLRNKIRVARGEKPR